MLTDTKTKLLKYFGYCQKAFAKIGMKIVFPKNTDPVKTYQWQYLETFNKRLSKNFPEGISDDTIAKLIEAMVEHAKSNNKLSKGLAVICQGDLMDVGFKKLSSINESIDNILAILGKDAEFLSDKSIEDLLGKPTPVAFPNIIYWHRTGRISKFGLAVSKKCRKVMAVLPSEDRTQLPSISEIFKMQAKYFKVSTIRAKTRLMFKGDFSPD